MISFKIVKKVDDIDMGAFFKFSVSDLRGHELKLEKPRAKKSIRLNSFAHRVVTPWNNLPAEIINAKTVDTFKTRLDKHWINKRYDMSDIY